MAKIGYIMVTSQYENLEEDRKWMSDFGCVHIIEEEDANEKHRPLWKQLMVTLERGDELVIAKFSMHCVAVENWQDSWNFAVSMLSV